MTNKKIIKWLQSLKSEIGKQSNRHLWNYEEALDMAIKALAKDEWIPVSERLPDVDIEVLTTTDWQDVLIAWLNKDGAWETEEFILANDEILAWMPLPKPYREDDEV